MSFNGNKHGNAADEMLKRGIKFAPASFDNDDSTECVSAIELAHLRQVFRAASDYRKGKGWPDFANQYGGQERLEQDLVRVTGLLEEWYADGDDSCS